MAIQKDLSIGQALRRERMRLGWTQERLAEAVGTTTMSVSRWEKDQAFPQPYYREPLCRALGFTIEDLFGLPEEQTHLWQVPYLRNRSFTGRQTLLSQLSTELSAHKMVAVTALHGLGGIGKTQLALEYAYRYREEYDAVFWLRAESEQTLQASYLHLASALRLPVRQKADAGAVLALLKHWLHTHTNWLLIVDNAEIEMIERITEIVPALGEGHMLVTTRSQALGPLIRGIAVEAMSEEEGALLLLRRSKLINDTQLPENIPTTLYEQAQEITQLLGGLPLALDQAGAYIEETQCSLADYLRLYHIRRGQLLARRGKLAAKDHPQAVGTTWQISFEQIEAANAGAADLLRLCAFLHPAVIQEELFYVQGVDLGETLSTLVADPLLWNEALGELAHYSLVRRNAEQQALSMHQLVQVVLQESMDDATRKLWAGRAVSLVNALFLDTEFLSEWSRCIEYLPQALVCCDLITQLGLATLSAGELLRKTAFFLVEYDILKYPFNPQMTEYLQRAYEILKQTYPCNARCLTNLARVMYYQANLPESSALLHQALSLHEQAEKPDPFAIAHVLGGLGIIEYQEQNYARAEAHLSEAISLYEQNSDVLVPDIGIFMTLLCGVYFQMGRISEAEPLMKRALSMLEKPDLDDHPSVVLVRHNIAVFYKSLGKYEQAEALMKSVIETQQKILPPHNLLIVERISQLAHIYDVQGQFSKAAPLHQQVLSSIEHLQSNSDSYNLAFPLYAVARHYTLVGRHEEAEALYRRILAIPIPAQNTLIGRAEMLKGVQDEIAALLTQSHAREEESRG